MATLLQVASAAVQSSEDPVDQLKRGISSYIDFQLDGGPVLILLQAEAMRRDSLLAPIREETLDALVALLDDGVSQHLSVSLDPLLYRGLLIGVEGLVIHVQRDGSFDEGDAQRDVVHRGGPRGGVLRARGR